MALEAAADTITIPEGGTLRLPCILPPTADENITVRWLYNSLVVSEDDNVTMEMVDADRARFTIQRPYASDWFLVIKPAQRKDAGSYACVANASTVISARVVIEYAPKIVGYPSRDIHMQVCERTPCVVMWCNVTGQPSPAVKWFYRKYENSPLTYIGLYNHMIFIPDVDHSNQGQYRCEVCNAHGNDVIVFHVHVIDRILTLDLKNPSRPGIMIHTGNAAEASSNGGHYNINDNNNNNALTLMLAGLVLLNVLE
ncbi:hypothetical protein DPMN_150290 [Dreissena polymorpha]|uniref:Ig-like domain-containing protein n=1 Tax=Dreissena polymorpha TaxID=45954 RepID=A0A9D4FDI1_DREPO|nr:hypothetical protein DPMN_150290 [Dreissena polymorpha]